MIICSECTSENDELNNYCIECGHKLVKIDENDNSYKEYCTICGNLLKKDDDYCGYCGREVPKKMEKHRVCAVCGEWTNIERFCWNCGHDWLERGSMVCGRSNELIDLKTPKKCPHCNKKFQIYFNYCEYCGTKLEKKKRRITW